MSTDEGVLVELRRIGRLIAMTAVRGLPKRDAAVTLAHAGYDFVEIGALLSMTRNAAQLLVQRAKARTPRAVRK